MRSRIGPYEVLSRLGAGGMGEVYRARDPRLGREVAIKVLPADFVQDRDRLRRFVAEAKAASALNHPNILTVHEIGEDENGPYIVTELVDGRTLRAMLEEGRLSVAQALDVAIQALDGLGKAHEAGIVHRDVKPENLMVTSDGWVKILDFGLAKLYRADSGELGVSQAQSSTATGMIVGTAGYLAPEQLRGARADSRSDVFAFGIVLYEMLTGENPFLRENAADTFSAILRDEPRPLTEKLQGAPEPLAQALRVALAKRPEDRVTSARQLASELKTLRTRLESGQTRTETSPVPPEPRRGRRLLVAGAAAVLLAAAAIGIYFARRGGGAAPAAVVLPKGQMAVAVLPVEDGTGDPELARARIGRVLADAFVQILSDIPRVYVVSPIRLTDVSRARGRPIEEAARDASFAAKVCRESGASVMLSGRLSRVGRTYILDTELTNLPDTLLGKFQATASSAEQILPELTGGISRKIQSKLGGPERMQRVDRVATGSLEAYEHFIKGYDLQNEGEFGKSLPELEKAVQIDPEMGLAWSFIACSYSFTGDDTRALAAQKTAEGLLDRVNQKERRWIELNGVWVKSKNSSLFRREAEKYIRDYPDDREGYFYAALAAEWLENNCREAMAYYEKAFRMTPAYYPITKGMVDCQLKLNRRADALENLRRYLALPALGTYGRAQAQGRLAELQRKG